MAIPYILRFQETFSENEIDSAARVTAGTKSTTLVRAEASDPDESVNTLNAFPRQLMAGTQTSTRVLTEGGDPDPHARGLLAIPRVCSLF
jgi:hypothetical protein